MQNGTTLQIDETPTAGSNALVTSGGVSTALASKQGALIFDDTPTAGSTNPVTSEGIKTAIDNVQHDVSNCVQVVSQTFTDEQKTQARNNIGAGTSNVSNLTDIAQAGDNIAFVVGTVVTDYYNEGGVTLDASGRYTTSQLGITSYIRAINNLPSTGASSQECQVAFKTLSTFVSPTTDSALYGEISLGDQQGLSYLGLSLTGTLVCQIWHSWTSSSTSMVGTTVLVPNKTYWVKWTFNSVDGYKLYLSENEGASWNLEASNASTSAPLNSEVPPQLGKWGTWQGAPVGISFDLANIFRKMGDTVVWKPYTDNRGSTKINSVIPSNLLINTATGSNSLSILGSSVSYNRITLAGVNSVYEGNNEGEGTAIGQGSRCNQYSTSLGSGANSGRASTALGRNSNASGDDAIAIGHNSSSSAPHGIAIGGNYYNGLPARVTQPGAIQIGQGTNSVANTMNVGLSSSLNVTLLNADGTIPADRLVNAPAPAGALINTTTNPNRAIGIFPASSISTGPQQNDAIAIGYNATSGSSGSVAVGGLTEATGNRAVALGYLAKVKAKNAIQLGTGTNEVESSLSVGLSPDGSTFENYQLLNAAGKIPFERITVLSGEGAPTTSTVGALGQTYIDTTNQNGYMCVGIDTVTPAYTWKQVTA